MEVATIDDGLNFTGNSGGVNKTKSNSLVKVQGEGVDETILHPLTKLVTST